MKYELGRWLVGIVGLAVAAVGIALVIEGVTRRFGKQLDLARLQGAARRFVVDLGVVGTTARGIVFAIAGALVVDASVAYDLTKSSGLDGALRALANRP